MSNFLKICFCDLFQISFGGTLLVQNCFGHSETKFRVLPVRKLQYKQHGAKLQVFCVELHFIHMVTACTHVLRVRTGVFLNLFNHS